MSSQSGAMKIDHIHFYVRDAMQTRDWLMHKMGFQSLGTKINDHTHTELLVNNQVSLRVSAARNDSSPIAIFLSAHPPGVGDVAFRVADLDLFAHHVTDLDIDILVAPQLNDQGDQQMVIQGWGDFQHTVIMDGHRVNISPEGWAKNNYITNIDHVVLNVAKNQLVKAAQWYQRVFGLQVQQSFNIQTAYSGLSSQAMIDPTGQVQFNINEPSSANSQIQSFLDIHGGAGIQHVALGSADIFRSVATMQAHGLDFLPIPDRYYQNLQRRAQQTENFAFNHEEWQHLEQLAILLDWSNDQEPELLLQIFTQPMFNDPTFFFEIIERRSQAKGFGEGNFQALFEAIEQQETTKIFN
jgi:4-hydroxyphenylpyruvate dioxygenase